jgi:hypothetical protein
MATATRMSKIILAAAAIVLTLAAASAHMGSASCTRVDRPSAKGGSLSGLASYGVVRPLDE